MRFEKSTIYRIFRIIEAGKSVNQKHHFKRKGQNAKSYRSLVKVQAYTKKKLRFFLFILVRTTTKSIQIISKPVMFLFWFFSCCCFGFINKAATTKNCQFIYDLSLLCLGLEFSHGKKYGRNSKR
jgi:hypothetical protein